MRRKLLNTMCMSLCFFFLTLGTAYCEGDSHFSAVEINKYNSFSEIPRVLRIQLKKAIYRERYVAHVLTFLRTESENKVFLSEQELLSKEKDAKIRSQKAQVSMLLKFDNNLDGQVEINEINNTLKSSSSSPESEENKKRRDEYIKRYRTYDLDNDGLITYSEMSILKENKYKHQANDMGSIYRTYLNLDIDGDNILTSNELEQIALKAFSTLDSDNNGILSESEKAIFSNEEKKMRFSIPESCVLPNIKDSSKLIVVSTLEGDSYSSVTITGQDSKTTAKTININEDLDEIVLILSSAHSVVWQINGNTEAVKHIFVHSKQVSNISGVSGISSDKVSFIDKECFPYRSEVYNNETINHALIQLVGRESDAIGCDGNLIADKKLLCGDGGVVKQNAPDGFDQRLWYLLIMYYPQGVTFIDPQTVVAAKPAVTYEVLPAMAGLAQLSYQGLIKPVDTDEFISFSLMEDNVDGTGYRHEIQMKVRNYRRFRIISNIPRYPPDMNIRHGSFILEDGVDVPKGNMMEFCSIIEKTGVILGYSYGGACSQ